LENAVIVSHSDARGQPRFRRGSGLAGIALCAALAAGCARDSGAPRTSLILFPPQPVVQVGGNIQLRADPSRGPLQWHSSDTTIAVVTQGLAQGIASGSALISASDGTDTGSVAITVTPANSVPSLSTDIQPIFNNYCVSCHEPPSPQENILLTDGTTSFSNLVNQPSPSIPTKTLVVPFDTAHSYLYDMIRGRASNSDDNMPQGCTSSGLSPCLPPSLVQLIASWILAGANP
jgi:hypothetical protein